MLRKFFCILAVVCILVSSFVVSSSAAVSLETSLFQPSNSVFNNFYLEYFAIFNDEVGYLISLNYNLLLSCDIVLSNNNLTITFTNSFPIISKFNVVVRDISNGKVLAGISNTVDKNSSYSIALTSLLSSNNLTSFSNLRYYQLFDNYHFTFTKSTSRFVANEVSFKQPAENGYLLSVLPEPVADHSNAFIVLQRPDAVALLVSVSWTLTDGALEELDLQLRVNSVGNYELYVWNKNALSINFQLSVYDVSNGFYLHSNYVTVPGNVLTPYIYSFSDGFSRYNAVRCYGVGLFNPDNFALSMPQIQWNYDLLTSQAILAQTTLLYTRLLQINYGIDELEEYLSLMKLDLDAIFDVLFDIRDALTNNGESYTQPPTDALDDYFSDESKVYDVLPTRMQDNLDYALGSGEIVFSGNGAFGLIRGLMQALVFDVPKLSGFVFFALAIGIAVLILGRKVNSG